MKGEFHIHTVYSDGVKTVREVLDVLKGNLDWFAITDHDVVEGSIEAYRLAKEYGLNALVGIEFSTYLNKEPVHILGYFKDDVDVYIVQDFLKDIRDKRLRRLYKTKDALLEYYGIDLDVTKIIERKSITRGTIATAIVEQGFPYTRDEVFLKLIGNDCKAYVPVSHTSPMEAIDIIHKAKGIAVLAHPVLLKKNKFEDICKLGVDGIEAIYPVNSKEDEEKFIKFANENNLVYTAGNDYHYDNCLNHGDLLELSIEGKPLEKFIERVFKEN